MQIFNSLGKKIELFKPKNPKEVNIFTCGPSIYLRPHIGNYRTFLYEDVLVRYLEYKGYDVKRGMNFTDIEDKAVQEAQKSGKNVFAQTEPSKNQFFQDIKTLSIKEPIIGMVSTSVPEAITIIKILLEKGFAYNHKGSIFFDTLKFKDFGKLYGLDKSKWPNKKIRYKKDTYPGNRWNLGDFILWHKADESSKNTEAVWESPWGPGRPSWNIQDPAIIYKILGKHIDINCGGIDNIIRHHDYNIAVMESCFGEPFANYYLHGAHLYIDGKKMSKSLGNIFYPSDIINKGYTPADLRLFLIGIKHYRKKLNFTFNALDKVAAFRKNLVKKIEYLIKNPTNEITKTGLLTKIENAFEKNMNNDLSLAKALKAISHNILKTKFISIDEVHPLQKLLTDIDMVFQINLL